MLIFGLITGMLGTAFSILFLKAVVEFAIANGRKFYFNLECIKRFLCDVVAICGTLACLAACVQLMAISFLGLR